MKHVEELCDKLVKLDVTELKHMTTYLKDKYGLEAAVAVQTVSEIKTEVEDDSPKYYALRVSSYGATKLQVVKELNSLTSVGLTNAKAAVDSGDPILKNRSIEEIKAAMQTFGKVSNGFTAEVAEQNIPWEE